VYSMVLVGMGFWPLCARTYNLQCYFDKIISLKASLCFEYMLTIE
jgi:hypothetical protein